MIRACSTVLYWRQHDHRAAYRQRHVGGCGTPADAVLFGLHNVYQTNPPDVVVSGVNVGQNTGATALQSGTVGATVMASELAVPAIAISVEVEVTTSPPTIGSVSAAAAYTAQLIRRLKGTADRGRLMPAHVALNVNYPAATPKGTKMTRLSRPAFVRPWSVPSGLCTTPTW